MAKYRFEQIAINSTEKKKPVEEDRGLSTLFQTNFFRLFFRYCTGV